MPPDLEGGHVLEGNFENLEAFARRDVRDPGLLLFSANEIGRGLLDHIGDDTSLLEQLTLATVISLALWFQNGRDGLTGRHQ